MKTSFSTQVKLLFLLLIAFIFGAFAPKLIDNQPITKEIVLQAQKILGLEFTESEADSMLNELDDTRKSFEKFRKFDLKNEVSPALYFNPLPNGFIIDNKQIPIKFSTLKNIELPKNKDDLAFFTVRELAELIKNRKITSLELTQFFIERLKKNNEKLQFVVSLTENLAFEQAKKADEEIRAGKYRGFLHGIPYGAKDLLATKNYKTTWGAMPYKDQMLDQDATVIKRLEEAGAVLCAKLTLGALAMGDVWFGGKTKNPWDVSRGSSGSSAGSASAVAAGCLPFAIGTETLGSIVSPSTECGTTGLRPTFGRVPRTGAMALSWSMDKIGPICRSVEDCAIVFDAIRGTDNQDFTIQNASFNYHYNTDLKGLKVGYLKRDFERKYPTKSQDSLSLVKLKELGATLIPIELPDFPSGDMAGVIIGVESASAFDELTRSNRDDLMVRQTKNAWPNQFRAARFIPAVEYTQANRLRTQLINEMEKVLKDIDVYISPSFGQNLYVTNLTGHPCLVLPNGFHASGRPTSISFTGKLFGEAKLLQLAKAFQDATDFHKKHPKI